MSAASMEPIEFGKYRLVRLIATGGMAQIYLAVQRGPHGFEKVAVLKVILPELCSDDDFVQMFLDEARLAANLDHNNVVRVYDFGEFEGRYYLAMEHLPGEDLVSVLQTLKRTGRMLSVEHACDIIVGAASGLHFAHELTDPQGRALNVVHRDVSPSNVLITYHGTVKLVDFGIARAETNITKTAAGTLKGKVAYVSPEQALGDAIDRRSDVFALGIVLYELLTMTRPFKRDSDLATLKAVLEAPVLPPSRIRGDVPAALDAIVAKAMSRPLAGRYQTAQAFADALSAFLVTRGYARGERQLSDLLAGLFDQERRQSKLRVAQTASPLGEAPSKTPSEVWHLGADLSPIRGTASLPSMPSIAPLRASMGELRTVVDALPRRRPLVIGAIAAGVFTLALGVTVLLRIGAPEAPGPGPLAVVPAPMPELDLTPEPEPEPEPELAPAPPLARPEPPKRADPVRVARAVARGKLTLDTTPWSEVYLRGKKLGDTPLVEVSLPAGIHVLTLVNEAKGIRRAIEVEIEPGKAAVKRLKL